MAPLVPRSVWRTLYHILSLGEHRYAVLALTGFSETLDYAHAKFRVVPGLERVKLKVAVRALEALNHGVALEEDYAEPSVT